MFKNSQNYLVDRNLLERNFILFREISHPITSRRNIVNDLSSWVHTYKYANKNLYHTLQIETRICTHCNLQHNCENSWKVLIEKTRDTLRARKHKTKLAKKFLTSITYVYSRNSNLSEMNIKFVDFFERHNFWNFFCSLYMSFYYLLY